MTALERLDTLNPVNLDGKVALSTAMVRDLLLDGQPLSVAWSGGKDSTAVLAIAVEGCREAWSLGPPGRRPAPLYVISADTGIENPAVETYRQRMGAALASFVESQGLDVRIHVAEATLATSWPVRIIGGIALPVYTNSKHRSCSWDLKRAPMQRLLKHLVREAEEEHLPRPVTLIGTRYGESASRDVRMAARGDTAREVRLNADGEPVLPLIADWSTDDVWEFLGSAGQGSDAQWPAFVPDFEETVAIYRDAAGECVIVAGERGQSSTACGARHGCWACTVVGTDASMETMLTQPKYAYMQGLNDFREYLVAIRYDWSRRRWTPRQRDPETGWLPFFPDAFHPEESARQLGMLLTLQRDEARRAHTLRNDVAAARMMVEMGRVDSIERWTGWSDSHLRELAVRGEPLDTEYLERMQRPQFHLVSEQQLLLIDFFWARYGGLRPFHALHIWDRVMNRGERFDVPRLAVVPQTPTPPTRWVPPEAAPQGMLGLYDALAHHLGERCPVPAAHLLKDGRMMPAHNTDAGGWQVDAEAAGLVLELELPELLHRHDAETWQHEATIRYYLALGVISMPRGQANRTLDMVQHSQALRQDGWDPAGAATWPTSAAPSPAPEPEDEGPQP